MTIIKSWLLYAAVLILAAALLCFALIASGVILISAAHGSPPPSRLISIGTQEITSYNCVAAQCDNEPDIGAYGRVAINGKPTGNWYASNFLAKGTKIIVPQLTGKKIWVCRDRLNEKVWWRIDLLLPRGSSIGLRRAEVFVVKEGGKK